MHPLEKHEHFLRFLIAAKKTQRLAILKTLEASQLQVLAEIILNVLNYNLILTKSDKNKLNRYKSTIRHVVKKGISRKKRQQDLVKLSSVLPVFVKVALGQRWRKN